MSETKERSRVRIVVAAPAFMLGGQARAAADIVAGFRNDATLQVTLQPIDPRLSGPLHFLTEWRGIRSIVRPILYIRGLRRALRDADVLHVFAAAHTAFLFGALPAIAMGRRFRVPIVLNYHDGRGEAHLNKWGWLLRWSIRRSALLVFPSPYLQRIFRAFGYDGMVVPNVVDTAAFAGRLQGDIPPRLISSRLLETLYAVDNTIRAFAIVREHVPDATLHIYGSGHAAESLRRLVRELDLSGVHFYGAVPHAQMPAVYGAGGILVNSSRIDNAPHVLIEAMAAGLPIVSTGAGGIKDMVENERTALLVPIDDPGALAQGVLRVLREPELARRLVGAGRDTIGLYTWEEAGRRWRNVYNRLAAAKPQQVSDPLALSQL